MRKLFFALLLLACCGSSAAAQTFPRSTRWELVGAAASIAADGYTTNYISPRFIEMNPIARPFISSTKGTVTYFSGSFAALVGANYLLRYHPKVRHILNWTVIGSESFLAVHNVRLLNARDCRTVWVNTGVLIPPCHL